MDRALQEHYDRKYSAERNGSTTEPVALTQRPKNRFEAAVRTLVKEIPQGARLLELGAGDGRIAMAVLANRPDLVEVVLSEVSQPRIEALRRATAKDERVSVMELDADRGPWPDAESFDVVVMVALLEHVIDPLSAMRGVHDSLRPGGFAYVDTPNVAKWTRRVKLAAGRFPSTASLDEGLRTYGGGPVDLYDEGHLHYFTFRSLTRMLQERCGFLHVRRAPYPADSRGPDWLLQRTARSMPALFSEVAVLAFS